MKFVMKGSFMHLMRYALLSFHIFPTWVWFTTNVCRFKQMCALGIYSRLDQVFDAPHAVKEVLIGQFGLEHSVYLLPFIYWFIIYFSLFFSW